VSDQQPQDVADARAEFFNNALKFIGLLVLTAATVVAVPIGGVLILEMIHMAPIHAAVEHAESGAVIGQTFGQLNERYRDSGLPDPKTNSKSYQLGIIDIDTAYYLHVTFDPSSGQATKAILEYSAESDAWKRDVTPAQTVAK